MSNTNFFFYFKKFLIKHADTVGLILTCSFAIGEQKVGCKLRRRIRRRTKRLRRRKMEKRKKERLTRRKNRILTRRKLDEEKLSE